jgi:hypothetical protein
MGVVAALTWVAMEDRRVHGSGGGGSGGGNAHPPYPGCPAVPPAGLNGVVCLPGLVTVPGHVGLPAGVYGMSHAGDQLPLCLNRLLWGRDCTGCHHRFHMNQLCDLLEACVPAFCAWMITHGLVFVNTRNGELPRAPYDGGRGRGHEGLGGRGGRGGRGGGGGGGRGRGPGAPAAPAGSAPFAG